MPVEASCHYGAVKLVIAEAPTEVTSCNCTICHRLGTLWAYYQTSQVQITGTTTTYQRGDKTINFHHCATCGCTTHWSPLPHREEIDRLGINARLLDPGVLAAARVRRLDGRSDDWKYLDD